MMVIEGLQLSPQQRHLWGLTQGEQVGVYQARCAVRLEGQIDKPVLRRAIEEVVRRHEILRTTFRLLPGLTMPVQVIEEIGPPPRIEIDLSSLTGERKEEEIETLFQRMNQQPFGSGSPLKTTLIRLSETEHVLLISVSAACADSITLDNLVAEIGRSYDAQLRSEKLIDAPLQYADISEVLNELLESEETETGRSYWQQHDVSSLETLHLPFETELSTAAPFETSFVPAQFAGDADSIVLLTCWMILLRRFTGWAKLVVGANYDGRSYEGLSEALGLFARSLPIGCDIDDSQTFADLLQQVNKITTEVQEWQDYFSLRHLPYCFEFESPGTTYVAGDLTFSIVKRHACVDRFKLKLLCRRANNSIETELHFDRALFREIDVAVLLEQFHTLMKSALDAPHRAVGELEMLGERERQRILIDFNRTTTNYPPVQSIQQLFEEQVARTPDAVAVTFEEQRLTYEELNARANQLAHHLHGLGVGPEHRVGLHLERGPEMLVGVLGILKSGASYVPLDPASPPERLAFIVAEARISILVIQATFATLANAPTVNPPHVTIAQNLAYIIYTSGSTGRPKGVMVEHASVVNLFFALRDTVYKNTVGPLNFGLNAPLIFDASVKQLLQLMQGHNVHIIPEEVRADPARFVSFIQRHRLSSFDCTPTQLKSLIASGLDAESTHAAAMILVGGEQIDEPTWRVLASNQETAYFNVYGPTECTVDTTVCGVRESPGQSTIGRPIANARVYILDEKLRPVPIGMPGEICVGGVGLARGYLDRPALTAEAFVPNPFATRPGERLYKTGDIACYLAEGRIKYLGRKDSQIKLSGYRIELKEIEAVIIEQPSVQDAVVVAKQNETRADLIAYIVSRNGELDTTELRKSLRERLPEYMVPGAYVSLPALPLTINGKVDRAKLPAPPKDNQAPSIKFEAPCTQIERTIATIWQAELKLEKVGIHDNFFDLGGSSLIMVRVFDRLQTQFDNRLKMVELFRHPTIATLAKHLSADQPEAFQHARVNHLVNRQKEARSRQRQARMQRAGSNGSNK